MQCMVASLVYNIENEFNVPRPDLLARLFRGYMYLTRLICPSDTSTKSKTNAQHDAREKVLAPY